MLCEVDRSYIEDGFNLYGLRHHFTNFQGCLDIILDRTVSDEPQDPSVAQAAFMLYGMIHARFIVTARGLEAMYKKYRLAEFGRCPRTMCRQQPVVPVGIFDEPKKEAVKLYCPRCGDVYNTVSPYGGEPLDGAFFGTSFAHLFFITFDRLVPDPARETYTPLIFGFKIHKSAKCMQRRLPHGRGSPPPPIAASAAAATATNSSASSSAPAHLRSPRAKGRATGGAAAAVSGGSGRSDFSNVGRGSGWGDGGGESNKGVLWSGMCTGEGSAGSAVMSGRDGREGTAGNSGGGGGGAGGSGRSRSGGGSGSSRRKSRRSSTSASFGGTGDGGGGGGGGRSSSRTNSKGKGKDKRRRRDSPGGEERDDDAGESHRRDRRRQEAPGSSSKSRREGSQDSAASGRTQGSIGGSGNTSANGAGGRTPTARSPSLSSAHEGGDGRAQQGSDRTNQSIGGQGQRQGQADIFDGRHSIGDPGSGGDGGRERAGEGRRKELAHDHTGRDIDGNNQRIHEEHSHHMHMPGNNGRGQQQDMGGGGCIPTTTSLSSAATHHALASVAIDPGPSSSGGMRRNSSNGGNNALSAAVRDGGGLATLAVAATISGGGSFSPPKGSIESVDREMSVRASQELLDVAGSGRYRREVDVAADSRDMLSDLRMSLSPAGAMRPTSYLSMPIPMTTPSTSSGSGTSKLAELDGHGECIRSGGPRVPHGIPEGDVPPCGVDRLPQNKVKEILPQDMENDAQGVMGTLPVEESQSMGGGGGARASLAGEKSILLPARSTVKMPNSEEVQTSSGVASPEREAKRMRLE